jgi:hypothetical protein
MCLDVSRDGTRVIALGLITYCKSKESLIILISNRIQGPMYTNMKSELIGNKRGLRIISGQELFPMLRLRS